MEFGRRARFPHSRYYFVLSSYLYLLTRKSIIYITLATIDLNVARKQFSLSIENREQTRDSQLTVKYIFCQIKAPRHEQVHTSSVALLLSLSVTFLVYWAALSSVN